MRPRWIEQVPPATGAALWALAVRSGREVLFLPYQAARIAIFETMGQGEVTDFADPHCRVWFVVDELDVLGRINGLQDALARLRKAGGRCVLGFQSIAQVSNIYGQGEARTIVENCSNTLILRCSASEGGGTAEFATNPIGRREAVRQKVSTSESSAGFGPSSSSTNNWKERRIEQAVLASEIEALADRQGYLKLASASLWMRVNVPAFR